MIDTLTLVIKLFNYAQCFIGEKFISISSSSVLHWFFCTVNRTEAIIIHLHCAMGDNTSRYAYRNRSLRKMPHANKP